MLAWVIIGVVLVAVAVTSYLPQRLAIDNTPALRVGSCLTGLDGDVVNAPPEVDCDRPHRAEVFANFDLPAGPYPGRDKVIEMTSDACKTRFEVFIGRDLKLSELNEYFVWPIEATWQTNREVTCIAFDYADVKGTLRNADR